MRLTPLAALAALAVCAQAHAATRVLNRRVERSQTLAHALRAAGLADAEVSGVIGALTGVFDFRKSRDNDQLRLVVTDGQLTFFDYRQSPVDEWQVRRDGDKWLGAKRDLQVERQVATVELEVESSLYEAALAAREDPVIAIALSDVFAWDVDFYSDVRKGDRVRAVVEKVLRKGRLIRYGEVMAASYQGQSVGNKRVFRYELPNGERSYYQQDGNSARRSFLKSPLKYAHVTSGFGKRFHPILNYVGSHNGVDYGTPVGTPVWAVSDGTVLKATRDDRAGNHVCLRHMNGFETCYLHLSGFGAGVRSGARVSQKQVIGYSGNTGLSTGPHLHFALKRNGNFVNPLNQNFPRAEPLPKNLLPDFKEKVAPYVQALDGPLDGPKVAAASAAPPSH
jgi:murein DD-endopeptidase MepM/ murein hydrolase activator NlpD